MPRSFTTKSTRSSEPERDRAAGMPRALLSLVFEARYIVSATQAGRIVLADNEDAVAEREALVGVIGDGGV